MFVQPTRDQCLLLEQMNGGELSKLIDAELAAILERLVAQKDPVTLHQLQGRAQALQEFQQAMRDARQTLAKLGQAPR